MRQYAIRLKIDSEAREIWGIFAEANKDQGGKEMIISL